VHLHQVRAQLVAQTQGGVLDGAVPVSLPGHAPGLSLVLEYYLPDLPGAPYVALA
jgi:hypothetical protein